jgi:hypothetical protein
MPQIDPFDPAYANLRDAIHQIVPTTVLVRIFSANWAVTHLFEADFNRVSVYRETEDRVARMIKRMIGSAADWRHSHDFHLPTGKLYLTPEPHQKGFVPEDDFTFGLSPSRLIEIFGRNNR